MDRPQRLLIKEFLINGPEDAPMTFIFAHGAGKGMSTPFMDRIAAAVADAGFRVVRFHFPYMENMVRTGVRKPPNSGAALQKCYADVVAHFKDMARYDPRSLVIGGKSMGGRIASMIADYHRVAGVACLGYPFHAPSKPQKTRFDHLRKMRTPVLICQGERDIFGNRAEVSGYGLPETVRIEWIPDGDHSFKPRKKSGHTEENNVGTAAEALVRFMRELEKGIPRSAKADPG